MENPLKDQWALVLGASSGFGEATALELARHGMHIFGVHLDRHATLPNVERIIATIESEGQKAIFFNVNAASQEKRNGVLGEIADTLTPERKIRIFLHSLAFGTLKPYIASETNGRVQQRHIEMTLDVMANSLVYWVQDLVDRQLLSQGGRVFAMTSAGGQRVWKSYGAVSAAKAALESHVRQLALELAPADITVNAIMAGVTDTPSLRKIPGHEEMLRLAKEKNPHRRLTTPRDVASAIASLSLPGTAWMTGNVIQVDGGEFITD